MGAIVRLLGEKIQEGQHQSLVGEHGLPPVKPVALLGGVACADRGRTRRSDTQNLVEIEQKRLRYTLKLFILGPLVLWERARSASISHLQSSLC